MTLTVTLPATPAASTSSGPAATPTNASANSSASSGNASESAKSSGAPSGAATTGTSASANTNAQAANAAGHTDNSSNPTVAPNLFAQMLVAQMDTLGGAAPALASASADAPGNGTAAPAATGKSGTAKSGKTTSQTAGNPSPLLPNAMLLSLPQSTATQDTHNTASSQSDSPQIGTVGTVNNALPTGAQQTASQQSAASSASAAASAASANLSADDASVGTASGKHGAGQQILPLDANAQTTILPQPATQADNTASAKSAAVTPTFNIDQSMGTPAWNKAISDQVMTMVSMKAETAHIEITPPQLGPIQVTLKMDGQNNAQVTFSADSAATRAALEGSLPRLHSMMAASGIQLGDAQVSSGQSQGQQQQSSRSTRTVVPTDSAESDETDTLASIKAARGVLSIFA